MAYKGERKAVMYKKLLVGIFVLFSVMLLCSVCAGADTTSDFEFSYSVDFKTCGIKKYNGNASEVTIPSKYDGKKVTTIEQGAFSQCTDLKSVTIPKGVKRIEFYAFSGCKNLKSVTLPSGLEVIEGSAFSDCTSLEKVNIPKSVKSIGPFAFDDTKIFKQQKGDLVYIGKWLIKCNNTSITAAKIKSGTLGIADRVFYECRSLKSVTIPKSVKYIGDNAFSGCALKSVTIPKGVKKIGNSAFAKCTGLTSVVIPKGVTEIGSSAFVSCKNLASVSIPSTVKSIGINAFSDTKAANSQKGAVYIGKWLVECNNKKITSLKIKCGTRGIADSALSCCESLKSVTIPKGVKYICSNAFEECTSLKSVTLPDGVVSVEEGAFYSCSSLNSVTIPKSVTYIGSQAFGCSPFFSEDCNLKDVYYKGSEEDWEKLDTYEEEYFGIFYANYPTMHYNS